MAIVVAGWVMPSPPVEGAVPTYFMDDDNCYLLWSHPITGQPASEGPHNDIPWPFGDEDVATRAELEALGFQDVDMM